MRILLAEDERSLSRAVAALLERNHYAVDAVYDGREALDYLAGGNYDALILYFITLAVGRFIYFDFTWHDFCSTVHGVLTNLPLLALMGCYSAFVCWYGFHTGFLLTSNGVILSTLLAHLFMDASIFVLDRTRLLQLFL